MAFNEVRSLRIIQRWHGALILALSLLLFTSPACQAAVRFDAIIGYSGVSPKNAWFPVTCELQNDGPSFNAIIEVSTDGTAQSQVSRLALELPSNTQKRVILPIFSATDSGSWSVRLLNEKGKVLAEPNYIGARRSPGSPALAVISRSAAGLPVLPSIRMRSSELQPVAVRLQPELFPDNPIVLDGLPALYLSSARATQLSVPQVNALLAWVQRGGHLILGVEQVSDVAATEWLSKMMPCELTSNGLLKSHPEFQQWIHDYAVKSPEPSVSAPAPRSAPPTRRAPPVANGPRSRPPSTLPEISLEDLKEVETDPDFESTALPLLTGTLRDGKVILGSASTPLAIQAPRGRGQITVLTFSPEREPFLSWKNRAWFWTKLAGVPSDVYRSTAFSYNSGRGTTDGIFGAMIDSKQIRKLSIGWLMLLLAAYLVVIGPLDQYCLKKLNRQMLTWITFPFYVLGFSGLIYLIGFHLRAGDLEYSELNVVDILPNTQLTPYYAETNEAGAVTGDTAVLRGQSHCSIYSPANEKYPLVGEQPFATLRSEFDNWGLNLNSHASVIQRGNGFQAEAFVPVWSSQLFVSDWLQPAPLPLTLKVQESPSRDWLITIDNKTGRAFTRAHIALAGRIFDLGELPAQKTRTFTLARERGTMLNDFANSVGGELRAAAETRHTSFGNSPVGALDVPLASMAASFSSLINRKENDLGRFLTPKGLDLAGEVSHGRGVLLAWDADHSFTTPINRFSARRLHRDTLLRLVFPVQQQKVTDP